MLGHRPPTEQSALLETARRQQADNNAYEQQVQRRAESVLGPSYGRAVRAYARMGWR